MGNHDTHEHSSVYGYWLTRLNAKNRLNKCIQIKAGSPERTKYCDLSVEIGTEKAERGRSYVA